MPPGVLAGVRHIGPGQGVAHRGMVGLSDQQRRSVIRAAASLLNDHADFVPPRVIRRLPT
jgi:hypothetical protein